MGSSERVAAAVIRAWLETDHEPVLKVRISRLTETGELRTIGTAASAEAACQIVSAWLAQLTGPEVRPSDTRQQSDTQRQRGAAAAGGRESRGDLEGRDRSGC
jgi:hypothetical protein